MTPRSLNWRQMRSVCIRLLRTLPPSEPGQALSIAKTKPRRQTVSWQRTLDEALALDFDDRQDQAPNPPGRGTGIISIHDQLPALGTVVPGNATSVVTTRGAVDQDDASTQVDDDMAMQPTALHGRDWDMKLPLLLTTPTHL